MLFRSVKDGKISIVEGLSLTDFDKQMLANTGQELMEERAGVEHLLK